MTGEKRIALVTGANKGIGFEIARQLGVQGITVLVGARDLARGEEAIQKLQAEKIEAVVVQLDVTDQTSIDEAASFIEQTYGRLDILVNNAGISVREWNMHTPPSQLALADFQKTFATNVFGAFAITQAMLPLLRRSQAGRIVNLSSEMGSLSINSDASEPVAQFPPTLAYNASKTTLNAFTVFLARELQDTSIKVNSVSPGYVSTDLNGHSGYLTAEQGAKVPVAYATLPTDGPTGGFFGASGQIAW